MPVPRAKAGPLTTDEHPRETSAEALARLRPAFRPDGCVTAGSHGVPSDSLPVAPGIQRERLALEARVDEDPGGATDGYRGFLHT